MRVGPSRRLHTANPAQEMMRERSIPASSSRRAASTTRESPPATATCPPTTRESPPAHPPIICPDTRHKPHCYYQALVTQRVLPSCASCASARAVCLMPQQARCRARKTQGTTRRNEAALGASAALSPCARPLLPGRPRRQQRRRRPSRRRCRTVTQRRRCRDT